MIRILSIEDHKTFISGLRSEIRADRHGISISCAAESMKEAMEINPGLFDVILLDLLLPGTDPLDNIALLKKTFPGRPIIILTSEGRSVWEIKMERAGVQAFLTKHDDIELVKAVIKKVYQEIGNEIKKPDPENSVSSTSGIWALRLKPKEKEILTLMALDKNFKQISDITKIKITSVYKIVSRLKIKSGIYTNSGLLRRFKIKS